MSRPIIVRAEAEADIRDAYLEFELIRPGLGDKFLFRLQEVLNRIELFPELYGFIWQDVRAVRLKQFRHVLYYANFSDYTEVLAVMHGARDSSSWQSRI